MLLCAALVRIPGSLGWVMLAVCVASALYPASVLLIVAAVIPIANPIGAAAGFSTPVDAPLASALIAGTALRWTVRDEGTGAVPASVPLLALIVASSFVVQAAVLHERIGPDLFGERLLSLIHGGLFTPAVDLGHRAAAIALQGLGLLAVTLKIVRAEPGWRTPLVRMVAIGGAAAAAMNLTRLASLSLSSAAPLERASELLQHLRVDTLFADPNGAGSFFVLALGCAAGVVACTRGRERAGFAIVCAAILAGLWLTRSRAGFLAVILTGVAGAFVQWWRHAGTSRRARRPGVAVAGIVAGLAVAVLMFSADGVMRRAPDVAIQTRRDMAVASMRLFHSAPVFGVGIGKFFERSADVIQDLPVRAFYPRENAHNNFLQVLAELGATGFLFFTLVLGTMYRRAWRAVRAGAATRAELGAALGVTAFLLSALLGHPLLIAPIAFVFWITLGAIGAAGERPTGGTLRVPADIGDGTRPRRRLWPVLIAIGLAATVPLRVRGQIASLTLEHYGYGLSVWHTDASGVRYRVADGAATVFVPGDSPVSEIPLFVADADAPVTLSISIESRVVNRVTLIPDTWLRYRLGMRENPGRAYVPVTIQLEGATRAELRIGRVSPVAAVR